MMKEFPDRTEASHFESEEGRITVHAIESSEVQITSKPWYRRKAVAMVVSLLVVVVVTLLLATPSSEGRQVSSADNNLVSAQQQSTPTTAPQSEKTPAPTTLERVSGGRQWGSKTNVSVTAFAETMVPTLLLSFLVNESQCQLVDGILTTGLEQNPYHPEIDYITPDTMEVTIGNPFNRTFDVVPNHTVLDNGGVIFNIETTPAPLPQHLFQTRLSSEEVLEAVQKEAGKFYHEPTYPLPPIPNVTVEVMSDILENSLVFAGGQGFVAACMLAFANHLPLALSPDHLWAVISSGWAYHVNQHAEELRHHFVKHTGKLNIEIKEDSVLQSQSSASAWESLIFPKFAEKIRLNMNNTHVYGLLVEETFSTTTPTSHAASRITLMAALKAYYTYSIRTSCGIPQIQLEGSREDWFALRDRTEQLAQWMMVNDTQGDLWIKDVVLPILDQFIEAYDGDVNYCFWQNMVKFRRMADNSGAYEFLSGWLPTLFPYINVGNGEIRENRFLRHWSLAALGDEIGPNPNQIPIQLSSAQVLWKYYEREYPLHFHAGFRGVEQLEKSKDVSNGGGMLRPVLGWYITYDPEA